MTSELGPTAGDSHTGHWDARKANITGPVIDAEQVAS
jgi:hypothetical protein